MGKEKVLFLLTLSGLPTLTGPDVARPVSVRNIPEVVTPKGRKFQSIGDSQSIDHSILQSFDCVVITTNHSVFEAEMIKEHAKLIVDLRNVIKDSADNLFKL